MNREDWAKMIPTTLKEVSLTLTWLADDLGVIGRHQRPRLEDGKPAGSQTFAWPIITRIQELLDYYQEHGVPMPVTSRKTDKGCNATEPGDGLEGNSDTAFEATPPPPLKATSPLCSRQSLSYLGFHAERCRRQ